MKKRWVVLWLSVLIILTCTVVNADDLNWGAYVITVSDLQGTMASGQNVKLTLSVHSTVNVESSPTIYALYYQEHGNSETYPGVDFGTISGTGYSTESQAITIPANGTVKLTLTGNLPSTWNNKSVLIILANDNDNGRMGQLNYPDHSSDPYGPGIEEPTSGSHSSASAPLSGTYEVGKAKVNIQNGVAIYAKPTDTKAKTVTIPAAVKVNGQTVPVTAIADNAFSGMKKMTSITIGQNVQKIGKNAFKGCSKLKKITIKTIKLTKKSIGANAFKGIHKKAVIKCPKAKKATYKNILLKKGMKKTMTFK